MTLVGESDSGESIGRPDQKAEGEVPVKETRPLASRQESRRKEGIKAATRRTARYFLLERTSERFLAGRRRHLFVRLPAAASALSLRRLLRRRKIYGYLRQDGKEGAGERKEGSRKEPLLLRGGGEKVDVFRPLTITGKNNHCVPSSRRGGLYCRRENVRQTKKHLKCGWSFDAFHRFVRC